MQGENVRNVVKYTKNKVLFCTNSSSLIYEVDYVKKDLKEMDFGIDSKFIVGMKVIPC